MDKSVLFNALKQESSETILALLDSAYNRLTIEDRRYVFGNFLKTIEPPPVIAEQLLADVETFHKRSLAGYYYEPFDIDSKNFSDVPEETEEWFEKLGDLLTKTATLTARGEHIAAITAFDLLYELIEKLGEGEEIVFADQLGSWMIPVDENGVLESYVTSLAHEKSAEAYAESVAPLLRRDSYSSLCHKMYARVIRLGNEEQKTAVNAIVKEKNIRIEPRKW